MQIIIVSICVCAVPNVHCPSKRYHNVYYERIFSFKILIFDLCSCYYVCTCSIGFSFLFFFVPKLFGGTYIISNTVRNQLGPVKNRIEKNRFEHSTEEEKGERKKSCWSWVRNMHVRECELVLFFFCCLCSALFIEWQRFRSIAWINWLDIIWLSFLCWLSFLFWFVSVLLLRLDCVVAGAGFYDLIEIRHLAINGRATETDGPVRSTWRINAILFVYLINEPNATDTEVEVCEHIDHSKNIMFEQMRTKSTYEMEMMTRMCRWRTESMRGAFCL